MKSYCEWVGIGKVWAREYRRVNSKQWFRRLFPTARRLLVECSLRGLRNPCGGKILVVGAGHDPYRGIFGEVSEYVRVDIVAISGSTDVVGDALALPFIDGYFDCILASECMEHMENPFLFVGELARVLKFGGRVIVTVPFMFHAHGDPDDYWRPTASSLKRLFGSFSDLEVMAQGNRLHVMWDLLTTAFFPTPILFPLRLLSHLLVRLPGVPGVSENKSTAPSGFLLVATK